MANLTLDTGIQRVANRSRSLDLTDCRNLVPVQRKLVTSLEGINRAGRSLGHYRERYQREIAFSVYSPDEPNEIYGPEGRPIKNLCEPEFVDFYA